MSASPERRASRSPNPPTARLPDHDRDRQRERERQRAAQQQLAHATDAPAAPVRDDLAAAQASRAVNSRAGGAYVPPHRLRAMLAEQAQNDNEGEDYQRLTWDALRKSINGLINKVNVANIKLIVPELFGENLIRGKGLFVRSVMRAQASSLPFTPIFASLVAIVNTKLPQVGELLLHRLIHQFRRSYKRNDKPTMTATTTFLAQLVNQQVAHEVLALQMLVLLLERPTDDSVEIAVSFMREVGAFLAENSARANNGIFDRFRTILNESAIDKRVQYMVEVLFQVRKDKYKDNPIIPEGLDLVEEEDMITHRVSLDDEVQVQEMLNVYKYDPNFKENEEAYAQIKYEILGSDDEDGSGDEGDTEESASDDESEVDDGIKADGTVDVHDQTGANVVNLRRTIYLTIMSALDFEEATHKLLKLDIAPGQEVELCNMVIECCSQERTFSKFYGLMGERFCKINQTWANAYEQCFINYYATIHRYETNRLRNIARFFGHLMMTDGIPWTVLDTVKMNEDDTTSSSRIFIKIMFQEMVEGMGLKNVVERFQDKALEPFLGNIFPINNPRNTRFSINFFTSIGLGAITEGMREHLKKMPALMLEQQRRQQLAAGGSSSSDSDSSSSLSSSSLSESSDYSSDDSRNRRPKRRDSRSPSRSRSRSRSYDSRDRSVSRSPPPRRRGRSPSYSRSPSPRRGARRARSYDSRSPSPPPRRGGGRSRSPSYSRSPSPRSRGANGGGGPPPRRRDSYGDARRLPSPPPPARRRGSPTPERNGPAAAPAPKREFVHPDRMRLAGQTLGGGGGGGMNGPPAGGRDFRHPDRQFDGGRGPPRGGGGGGDRAHDGGWGRR
ncbi:pre-mRNA-splicing factor cwc22 [Rhodotorula sphaerocarpa]